jgi:hypothetical protein
VKAVLFIRTFLQERQKDATRGDLGSSREPLSLAVADKDPSTMAPDEPSAVGPPSAVTVSFAALISLRRTHRQGNAHCSPTRSQEESQGDLLTSGETPSLPVPDQEPEVIGVTDEPSSPKTPSEVTFPLPALIFLSRTYRQASAHCSPTRLQAEPGSFPEFLAQLQQRRTFQNVSDQAEMEAQRENRAKELLYEEKQWAAWTQADGQRRALQAQQDHHERLLWDHQRSQLQAARTDMRNRQEATRIAQEAADAHARRSDNQEYWQTVQSARMQTPEESFWSNSFSLLRQASSDEWQQRRRGVRSRQEARDVSVRWHEGFMQMEQQAEHAAELSRDQQVRANRDAIALHTMQFRSCLRAEQQQREADRDRGRLLEKRTERSEQEKRDVEMFFQAKEAKAHVHEEEKQSEQSSSLDPCRGGQHQIDAAGPDGLRHRRQAVESTQAALKKSSHDGHGEEKQSERQSSSLEPCRGEGEKVQPLSRTPLITITPCLNRFLFTTARHCSSLLAIL